ncbi:hypothetical protein TRIP_C20426 [Candidatus Zixiibacteriota bacterium]|nr:hypothetical protein TRIP_C20426 [candidate division Zixibacteria bacterium]
MPCRTDRRRQLHRMRRADDPDDRPGRRYRANLFAARLQRAHVGFERGARSLSDGGLCN